MDETTGVLSFERSVPAPAEAVYYAFSTGQGWRDWLCDSAVFKSLPGGSYHLSWDTGWYASGRIEELNKPSRVRLSWRGAEDPAATQVTIDLHGHDDHTHVSVAHSGFGDGEAWERARQEAARGWEVGLENLESIFTTGADLRTTRRPMVGLMGNDFNETIADQIGVPVAEGVRIAEAIEGMGMAKAGIQANDVIVELDGRAIRGWSDLGAVLQRRRAGDTIPMVFYRGKERRQAEVQLSARPSPATPLDPRAFARELREVNAKVIEEIRAVFEGVSEAEAEFAPEGEWSATEILAHLIVEEDWYLHWIGLFLSDAEAQWADNSKNRREQLQAVIQLSPTIGELLQRLVRDQETTASLLEASQEALGARKGVMWRLGVQFLHFPGSHAREHMEQIKKTLEAARAAEPATAAT